MRLFQVRQVHQVSGIETNHHDSNAILSFNREVNGMLKRVVLTVDEYQPNGFGDRVTTRFFEEEINREVRIFGSIAITCLLTKTLSGFLFGLYLLK